MTRFEALLESHLAGALRPDEEREFQGLLAVDENRRVFEAHRRTAGMLAGMNRPPLSPTFTEEVLARLPERRAPWWETLWDALWAPRALRWNLASAVGLSLVLAAAPLVWETWPSRAPEVLGQRSVVTAIRFSLDAAGARQVALAGDFNGSQPRATFLTDTTGRGHFSVTLPLKPGRYAYMFVVDGASWVTDPRAEAYRDDGFGNQNALVTIEDTGRDHGET